jgi:predicted peroxiredoxin
MGLGIAALFALVGLTVVLTGLGLVWATRPETEKVRVPAFKQVANPA